MGDKSPVEVEVQAKSSDELKEKMAYELAVDATFLFEDGQTIGVCKAILAFHSKFFMEAFFGPEPVTEIKIKGFDRGSFKTFLDCLLGIKEYTMLDALLIYPIAHRYDVNESLLKCEEVLEPEQMDENIPLVLNLSTFYKCSELTDFVIDFIIKYGVINFLENEKYCNVLEPLAILAIIENVDLNSLVWTLVYQWGENYVKERNESNVPTLFKKFGITEKISLDHFESTFAVIDFGTKTDDQLLKSNEILRFLLTNMMENWKRLPDRSDWIKIDRGNRLIEKIVFKRSRWASSKTTIVFKIKSHKILIEPNSVTPVVKIEMRYFCRKAKWDNPPSSSYDWLGRDYNFFYSNTPSEKYFKFSVFFPSDVFSFDQEINDDDELCCKFEVELERNIHEIHSVEVTYTFDFQGRILKTSLDSGNLLDPNTDTLFFTKDILLFEIKNTEK